MPQDNVVRLKPTRPCPICGKPSAQALHPFCSARCADIDLNRWLSGAYVIPGKSLAEAAANEEDSDELPEAATDEDE